MRIKYTLLFLCVSIICILSGCKKETKSADVILGDPKKSSIYNKVEKEDSNFKDFEEANGDVNEYTNDTDLSVVKSLDVKEQPVQESKGKTSGSEEGYLSPDEVEDMTIEEEFECDTITYNDTTYYIPLIEPFQIAIGDANFIPKFEDGITTLSVGNNNTITYMKIVSAETCTDEDLFKYFDKIYSDCSSSNTVSNLKMGEWKEYTFKDYTSNYNGMCWTSVENAQISYHEIETCWMKVNNYYLIAEYSTNNEDASDNIEIIAQKIFPNFLYVNNIVEFNTSNN